MKSKNKRKRRGGRKGKKGVLAQHHVILRERERERVIVIPNELSRD